MIHGQNMGGLACHSRAGGKSLGEQQMSTSAIQSNTPLNPLSRGDFIGLGRVSPLLSYWRTPVSSVRPHIFRNQNVEYEPRPVRFNLDEVVTNDQITVAASVATDDITIYGAIRNRDDLLLLHTPTPSC